MFSNYSSFPHKIVEGKFVSNYNYIYPVEENAE